MPKLKTRKVREAGAPDRAKPKHLDIFNAKASVEAALENLRLLLDDIRQVAPEEESKNPTEVNPSLADVLNHTGQEISELSSEIIGVTNEIRAQIL